MARLLQSRVVGSLVGLAVCDAVGTTVEFLPPGSFTTLEDMIGGGKFNLLPGQWTDDSSMALCLAESLIECQAFNPVDQSKRYWKWYEEGHLSSNGECFDIGMTVLKALNQFQRSGEREPYCGPTSDRAGGNGSLMRLCPVPLVYHRHPTLAMQMAQESSRTTHGAKTALDACRYFSGLIVGCLQGVGKETLLSPHFSPTGSEDYWKCNPLVPEVEEVVMGSYKKRQPPEIVASGYVVRSLEAVLWAFYHTHTFKEGCLKVANLGNDADTVGAIYGQLAGAFYRVEGIPEDWKQKCSLYNLIELFGCELLSLADVIPAENIPPDSIDWNTQYPPLPASKLGDTYVNIKLKGYNLLESQNREIVRRVNPCPKEYKRLEDFDEAVASLEKSYKGLPEECQNAGILGDFQRRWAASRTKLELKLGRGRV